MAAIEIHQPGDGSLRIVLNRPERLNAFTPEMYRAIRDGIRQAEADVSVEVVVISGSPRAFATGADVDSLDRALSDPDPLAVFEFEDSLPFNAIRDCVKTTVAVVQGLCLGAGFIIAALCDLVVAADDASFGIPEARLGFSDPFAPTALFTKLPTAHLKYLLFTGDRMSADEGWRLGFVSKVVEPGQLGPTVDALIKSVQQTTPGARANYKKYVNDLLPRAETKAMYADLLSDEGRAAVAAFIERKAKQ